MGDRQTPATSLPDRGGAADTAGRPSRAPRSGNSGPDPQGAHVRAPAAAARGEGVPASRRVGFGAQPRLGFRAGHPVWRRCVVGHSPPGCSLLAPCQPGAALRKPCGIRGVAPCKYPPAKPGALAVSRSKRPWTWPLRGHLGHPTGGYFIPTGSNLPTPSRCRRPGGSDQGHPSGTAQPPRFLPPWERGQDRRVAARSTNWRNPAYRYRIVYTAVDRHGGSLS